MDWNGSNVRVARNHQNHLKIYHLHWNGKGTKHFYGELVAKIRNYLRKMLKMEARNNMEAVQFESRS